MKITDKMNEEMRRDEITELKMAINQFIWSNGPPDMTLEDADKVACEFLRLLRCQECLKADRKEMKGKMP